MLGWLGRKLDYYLGATAGAGGGAVLSQLQAFVHQYQQRLGGHLDEARGALQQVQESGGTDTAFFAARVDKLTAAREAIEAADPLLRPFAWIQHLDPRIAEATFEDFTPAVPVDPASLIYAAAGVVVALLLYDLLSGMVKVLLSPLWPQKETGLVRR